MSHVVRTDTSIDLEQETVFDAAVVIPTLLRPTLGRAVRSIYAQRFPGRIQVMLGVDQALGSREVLDELSRECPSHCALTILDLGYSTSAGRGGIYPGCSGGALRTILSYAANSRAVAYLDDDNWCAPDHLRSLRDALQGFDYAFSWRWYVDPATDQPLCVDEWESVGPGAGVYRDRFGGFIDPNCLMIDKLNCDAALRWWCFPLANDTRRMSEDRLVYDHLSRHHRGRATGMATSFYVVNPNDEVHAHRMQWAAQKNAARGNI